MIEYKILKAENVDLLGVAIEQHVWLGYTCVGGITFDKVNTPMVLMQCNRPRPDPNKKYAKSPTTTKVTKL